MGQSPKSGEADRTGTHYDREGRKGGVEGLGAEGMGYLHRRSIAGPRREFRLKVIRTSSLPFPSAC